MKQAQLTKGTSDNTKDCYGCSAYSPNGEGVFHCRHADEWDVNKCECCGHCNAFKAITDDDAESWLKQDAEDEMIVRTTFNRWRWNKVL